MTAPKPPNPAEFVCVPLEPEHHPHIVEAGLAAAIYIGAESKGRLGNICHLYRTMLAAAPSAGLVPVEMELLRKWLHRLADVGDVLEDRVGIALPWLDETVDELRAIIEAQKGSK